MKDTKWVEMNLGHRQTWSSGRNIFKQKKEIKERKLVHTEELVKKEVMKLNIATLLRKILVTALSST